MTDFFTLFGIGTGLSFLVLLAVAWTIFWKGWALWISARDEEVWWFIAMLIINTFGILEIIYIFAVKKYVFNFTTRKFELRKVVDVKPEEQDRTNSEEPTINSASGNSDSESFSADGSKDR